MPELPPPPPAGLPPAPSPGWAPNAIQPARPNYAGFWIRVGAGLIDGLVLLPVYVIVAILILGSADGEFTSDDPTQLFRFGARAVAWSLVLVAIRYLYLFVMIGKWNATVGKFATGLRVRRPDGSPAGWREAALRPLLEALLTIANLGIVSLLDVLWMLWDAQKQTLHDKIASTIVVKQ